MCCLWWSIYGIRCKNKQYMNIRPFINIANIEVIFVNKNALKKYNVIVVSMIPRYFFSASRTKLMHMNTHPHLHNWRIFKIITGHIPFVLNVNIFVSTQRLFFWIVHSETYLFNTNTQLSRRTYIKQLGLKVMMNPWHSQRVAWIIFICAVEHKHTESTCRNQSRPSSHCGVNLTLT